MEFKDRILEYRKSLKIKTQKEMAEKLGVARQFYSNVETGYRPPSKQMLEKLVEFSGRPEYYWLYGFDENEYINERKEFKCLYAVLEELKETDALNLKEDKWSSEVESILLTALKADILHMQLKDKIHDK